MNIEKLKTRIMELELEQEEAIKSHQMNRALFLDRNIKNLSHFIKNPYIALLKEPNKNLQRLINYHLGLKSLDQYGIYCKECETAYILSAKPHYGG